MAKLPYGLLDINFNKEPKSYQIKPKKGRNTGQPNKVKAHYGKKKLIEKMKGRVK